jgi:magnesium-transporting ATPase (P-type)
MDVLCADKTGTITRNGLTVAAVGPIPPATAGTWCAGRALLDEATQDRSTSRARAARRVGPTQETGASA